MLESKWAASQLGLTYLIGNCCQVAHAEFLFGALDLYQQLHHLQVREVRVGGVSAIKKDEVEIYLTYLRNNLRFHYR